MQLTHGGPAMDKRFWICGLLVAIAAMVLGFVVHGVLLKQDYAALVGQLVRAPEDANRHLPAMLAADLCIGFAMTWLHRQIPAHAGSALRAGVRFGLAVALVSVVPQFLIYYTIQPLPIDLRPTVIDSFASLVAPGGTLVVVARGRGDDEEPDKLPWPLSRRDLSRFLESGLSEVSFEEVPSDEPEDTPRFIVEYTRP